MTPPTFSQRHAMKQLPTASAVSTKTGMAAPWGLSSLVTAKNMTSRNAQLTMKLIIRIIRRTARWAAALSVDRRRVLSMVSTLHFAMAVQTIKYLDRPALRKLRLERNCSTLQGLQRPVEHCAQRWRLWRWASARVVGSRTDYSATGHDNRGRCSRRLASFAHSSPRFACAVKRCRLG